MLLMITYLVRVDHSLNRQSKPIFIWRADDAKPALDPMGVGVESTGRQGRQNERH